jgi:REP element-mobilizing transposase RayT
MRCYGSARSQATVQSLSHRSGKAYHRFLTVCTHNRARWLASEVNHQLLVWIWTIAAKWLVGHYVLLPDHLHLFAAPADPEFSFERGSATGRASSRSKQFVTNGSGKAAIGKRECEKARATLRNRTTLEKTRCERGWSIILTTGHTKAN